MNPISSSVRDEPFITETPFGISPLIWASASAPVATISGRNPFDISAFSTVLMLSAEPGVSNFIFILLLSFIRSLFMYVYDVKLGKVGFYLILVSFWKVVSFMKLYEIVIPLAA